MKNKKNISQNIQAADIAQKAGFKYEDAELICGIADNIQKHIGEERVLEEME